MFYFLFLLLFIIYYIPFSMKIVGSITVGAYARILRHRRQVESGVNTRKRLDPLRVDSRLYWYCRAGIIVAYQMILVIMCLVPVHVPAPYLYLYLCLSLSLSQYTLYFIYYFLLTSIPSFTVQFAMRFASKIHSTWDDRHFRRSTHHGALRHWMWPKGRSQ